MVAQTLQEGSKLYSEGRVMQILRLLYEIESEMRSVEEFKYRTAQVIRYGVAIGRAYKTRN